MVESRYCFCRGPELSSSIHVRCKTPATEAPGNPAFSSGLCVHVRAHTHTDRNKNRSEKSLEAPSLWPTDDVSCWVVEQEGPHHVLVLWSGLQKVNFSLNYPAYVFHYSCRKLTQLHCLSVPISSRHFFMTILRSVASPAEAHLSSSGSALLLLLGALCGESFLFSVWGGHSGLVLCGHPAQWSLIWRLLCNMVICAIWVHGLCGC